MVVENAGNKIVKNVENTLNQREMKVKTAVNHRTDPAILGAKVARTVDLQIRKADAAATSAVIDPVHKKEHEVTTEAKKAVTGRI